MTQPTVVIDHAHLRHNVTRLVSIGQPAQVYLAVKTNAYGHGLVQVARTALASGATGLAVLESRAGVQLRESGVTAPLFAWLLSDDDIRDGILAELDLGLSRVDQLATIERHVRDVRASGETPHVARIHLKIDTGLTRNGATPGQWADFCRAAARLETEGLVHVVGIWTHLADTSPEEDAISLERFFEAVDVARAMGLTPQVLHAGASSAGLRFAAARLDIVRFGIAAYGISPFDDATADDLDLKPVMTVGAPVIAVGTDVAVVGAGYGHGILTGTHPERFVTINGNHHRVTNVFVDRMTIESNARPVAVGDNAVIFGAGGPSAEQLGAWCDTIGDEVVTSISPRLPRLHVNEVV